MVTLRHTVSNTAAVRAPADCAIWLRVLLGLGATRFGASSRGATACTLHALERHVVEGGPDLTIDMLVCILKICCGYC